MTSMLAVVLGLLLFPALARAADLPADAVRVHAVHSAKLRPSVRGWVSEQAKKLRQASPAAVSDASLRADIRTRFAGQSAKDQDVETLAMLVLTEAARDAAEDLKALQAQMKAANDARRKAREFQEKLRKQVADHAGRPDLRAIQEELKGKLDSMNEMSERTSLQLQMMMDRQGKLMSTLSNLLKKVSTTQDTLVQNLK